MIKALKSFLIFSCFTILCSYQGFTYRHVKTPEPLSIHILEVDPTQCQIFPAHAFNRVLGRATVQNIAKKNKAIAAVNAGFFKGAPTQGLPAGILKIDNHWYGLPSLPRGSIGWSQDAQKVKIDQLLTTPNIRIMNYTIPIDGLNRPRESNELIIYSPLFNASTRTKQGLDLVITENKISEIYEEGNAPIPQNGWVLSISPEKVTPFWKGIAKGIPVELKIPVVPQSYDSSLGWDQFPHIVGGTPVLIKNGRIVKDFSSEKTRKPFLTNRYSRTAVGLLPNGHWLFVVVDGGNSKISLGMTMDELALLMFNLGSKEALNLDGGGSSTMVIDNRVVNDPHGDDDEDEGQKKVRKVSDAILIKNLYE